MDSENNKHMYQKSPFIIWNGNNVGGTQQKEGKEWASESLKDRVGTQEHQSFFISQFSTVIEVIQHNLNIIIHQYMLPQ